MLALEFYSGIGGLHVALKRSDVDCSVVRAFDWDQTACAVYNANYGDGIAQRVDISTLTAQTLAMYEAELWLMSPACQPYTVLNKNASGADDPRAQSFLHLINKVLPDLVLIRRQPRYMLVENVGGFEVSATRQMLLSVLRNHGYFTAEFSLTPLQYGIPNSRLRYYLLARDTPFSFDEPHAPSLSNKIQRKCIGAGEGLDAVLHSGDFLNAASPTPCNEIRGYLDSEADVDAETLRVPDKVLEKWGRLFDIVLPPSRRTCCFTRGYTRLVDGAGSILQMNETLDTTKTFNEFFHAQNTGSPDAVSVLHPLRLRYFSPTELLRLFGFIPCQDDMQTEHIPDSFVWQSNITQKTKYRLIGNSVNVVVITDLINLLFE